MSRKAMQAKKPEQHEAVTSMRRESGLRRMVSTTWASWSMLRPSGAGQERHWWP